MSLLLFLAAAAVETAPVPAADAPVEPKAVTKRVCKSVDTPDSRLKKKVCTNVKVTEPAAPKVEAEAETPAEG